MSRFVRILSLAIAALFLSSAAHATTITYDLSLLSSSGPYTGTGSFTINGPIQSSGQETFSNQNGGLTNISFTINDQSFSQTFSLANTSYAAATFLNGALLSIDYSGQTGSNQIGVPYSGNLTWFFQIYNPFSAGNGTITAQVADPSATPLPGSLLLFVSGLGLAGLLVLRAKKAQKARVRA